MSIEFFGKMGRSHTGEPRVRLNRLGVVLLNSAAAKLVGLEVGDRLMFGVDNGVVYVMKWEDEDGEQGLVLRRASGNSIVGGLSCNAKTAVEKVARAYDVVFSERVKSVFFEIKTKSRMVEKGQGYLRVWEVVNRSLDVGELKLYNENRK